MRGISLFEAFTLSGMNLEFHNMFAEHVYDKGNNFTLMLSFRYGADEGKL